MRSDSALGPRERRRFFCDETLVSMVGILLFSFVTKRHCTSTFSELRTKLRATSSWPHTTMAPSPLQLFLGAALMALVVRDQMSTFPQRPSAPAPKAAAGAPTASQPPAADAVPPIGAASVPRTASAPAAASQDFDYDEFDYTFGEEDNEQTRKTTQGTVGR